MKTFEWHHKVQYYETDQMGIAHHSNYIRWFEEARVAMLDEIGYSMKRLESERVISPVISVNCDYKMMSHFEDVLVVSCFVESFNGVKLYIRYNVTDSVTGELRATGTSGHCFLDESGRPLRLKSTHPEFYNIINGLLQQETIIEDKRY